MQKTESITELAKAVIKVMKEVKGIDKTLTVGSGSNSYKGVSDKDVKNIIGAAMEKNGLCILPLEVEPTLQIDRWEETGGPKQKQSVFATVKTKYLLLHESGESIVISGYGHGTDSQDKAAGKATTYALKYALLYTFMVPTGTIDDTEVKHSDEIDVPKKNNYNHTTLGTAAKPLISNLQFKQLIERIENGEASAYKKALERFTFELEKKRLLDKEFAKLVGVDKQPITINAEII